MKYLLSAGCPGKSMLFVFVLAGCGLVLSVGCRSKQSQGAGSAAAETYQMKGIVVSSDPKKGEVTVDTEPIPGFMQAMIMPYRLAKPESGSQLQPGDQITATLRVSSSGDLLDDIHVTSQGRPVFKPSMVYNQPRQGQKVPDFSFTNQDGRKIHLDQFRGKALLVTFIYTRCPLPDYCIRMSRNFATINRNLLAHPAIYAKTHLLTVSFDPDHDTPAVLRRYGEAYIGGHAPKEGFRHWDFAAPSKAELKQVEEFFDVGVTPGANGTLNHSLSTVLISRDGKIAGWYPSNTWNPSEVLKALEDAAG